MWVGGFRSDLSCHLLFVSVCLEPVHFFYKEVCEYLALIYCLLSDVNLGFTINTQGSSTQEIKRRLAIARRATTKMETIWNSRNIHISLKFDIGTSHCFRHHQIRMRDRHWPRGKDTSMLSRCRIAESLEGHWQQDALISWCLIPSEQITYWEIRWLWRWSVISGIYIEVVSIRTFCWAQWGGGSSARDEHPCLGFDDIKRLRL